MAPAETPTPNTIPTAAVAVAAMSTSTTEEKMVHVESLPAAESEAEQTKTKTIPPKPETSESPPNSVTTKEVANTEEKKPPLKAQQSPQQQPEKTALKKEDSSNPVNESEAALKTPSNGGGGAGKSWASLFKKDTPENLTGSTQNKPMARIQPYTNMGEDGNEDKKESKGNKDGESQVRSSRHLNTNPNDLDIAKFLQVYALNHRSSMIKPRGLSNRNNWCFVNAILQALVACPTFYNLVKALPEDSLKKASMVKFTKAIHGFFGEFHPLDHFPKINRRDKG